MGRGERFTPLYIEFVIRISHHVVYIKTVLSRIPCISRTNSYRQVAVLLNNVAIGPESKSWEMLDNWKKTFDVNLFGFVVSSMGA